MRNLLTAVFLGCTVANVNFSSRPVSPGHTTIEISYRRLPAKLRAGALAEPIANPNQFLCVQPTIGSSRSVKPKPITPQANAWDITGPKGSWEILVIAPGPDGEAVVARGLVTIE